MKVVSPKKKFQNLFQRPNERVIVLQKAHPQKKKKKKAFLFFFNIIHYIYYFFFTENNNIIMEIPSSFIVSSKLSPLEPTG